MGADTGREIETSVGELKADADDLKAGAGDAAARLEASLGRLRADLDDLRRQLLALGQDRALAVGDALVGKVDGLRRGAQGATAHSVRAVETYVQEKPFVGLVAAFGAGFVLSRLLARS